MKFPQGSIIAGLRKRKESAQGATEAGPKRPCQREPGHPGPSSAALPEAILVGESEGEESLPAGLPIGGPPLAALPITVAPPAGETGGPPGGERRESPPSGAGSSREASAPESSEVSRSLPRPPQTSNHGGPYKSRLAETILKLASLPKFQAQLRGLSLEDSFDTMFTASLQTSNGLFVLREELVNARSRIESLNRELSEAKALPQEDLVKARSQIEGLTKELSEAKARELKALDDLRAAQEDNRLWRERAEKELQTLDATLTEVRARLLPTEERLKEAVLKLDHTENRADNAEAAARDAAERLALAEKETKEVLDKMAAAEIAAKEKIAAAEAHAQRAVEEYKNSPSFASECQEAVFDAFVQGFERCKRRLSRHFKLKDLGHFQPEDDEEATDAEAEEAVERPSTIEDPATEPTTTGGPATSPTVEEGHLGD